MLFDQTTTTRTRWLSVTALWMAATSMTQQGRSVQAAPQGFGVGAFTGGMPAFGTSAVAPTWGGAPGALNLGPNMNQFPQVGVEPRQKSGPLDRFLPQIDSVTGGPASNWIANPSSTSNTGIATTSQGLTTNSGHSQGVNVRKAPLMITNGPMVVANDTTTRRPSVNSNRPQVVDMFNFNGMSPNPRQSQSQHSVNSNASWRKKWSNRLPEGIKKRYRSAAAFVQDQKRQISMRARAARTAWQKMRGQSHLTADYSGFKVPKQQQQQQPS